MSGAILNVVYGIPLYKGGARINMSDELNDIVYADGFETLYSAYGEEPCYFGINICSLEESGVNELECLRTVPTKEEMDKYEQMFSALTEEIKSELSSLCPGPRVFFLWSSS